MLVCLSELGVNATLAQTRCLTYCHYSTQKNLLFELLVQNIEPLRRSEMAEGIFLEKASIIAILIENKDTAETEDGPRQPVYKVLDEALTE